MALVLEILLGVAILASFAIAYMSARTWPIYQVVIVALLFLSTVGFFYLAARTLATHHAWRSETNRAVAQLEQVERDTRLLQEGGPPNVEGVADPKGIRQLRQELQHLTIQRGGVLYNVPVDGVQDGVVQLTMASAAHGLTPDAVLFVFSDVPKQEGGRFLGEFRVSEIGDDTTKVQIAPNLPLTAAQAERLAGIQGTITVYTTMPIDDPAYLASLDEATRQALLPAGSVAAFANAERALHDYEQYFHQHFVQASLLDDAINKLNSNIERITAATQEADREAQFRQDEKTRLTTDLAAFQRERDAIAAYEQTLTKTHQQVVETMKSTYVANRQMAAQITNSQLEAAAAINRRADEAAGVGRP